MSSTRFTNAAAPKYRTLDGRCGPTFGWGHAAPALMRRLLSRVTSRMRILGTARNFSVIAVTCVVTAALGVACLAGSAGASVSVSPPMAGHGQQVVAGNGSVCQRARGRLPKLVGQRQHSEQLIAELREIIRRVGSRHPARLAVLEHRLSLLQTYHDYLVGVIAKIQQSCGTA